MGPKAAITELTSGNRGIAPDLPGSGTGSLEKASTATSAGRALRSVSGNRSTAARPKGVSKGAAPKLL